MKKFTLSKWASMSKNRTCLALERARRRRRARRTREPILSAPCGPFDLEALGLERVVAEATEGIWRGGRGEHRLELLPQPRQRALLLRLAVRQQRPAAARLLLAARWQWGAEKELLQQFYSSFKWNVQDHVCCSIN